MFVPFLPTTIQIRIRLLDDHRRWEDILPEKANLVAADYGEALRQTIYYLHIFVPDEWMEARWNWKGSTQGHYLAKERTPQP
jgi:hypothetical protein